MKKLALLVGLVTASTGAIGATVECHAFCGVPTALTDAMWAAHAAQIPTELAEGQSAAQAFDRLQVACKKLDAKSVPVRYLGDLTPTKDGFKVLLVPALAADVCLFH